MFSSAPQRRVSHDLVIVDDQPKAKWRWMGKEDHAKLVYYCPWKHLRLPYKIRRLLFFTTYRQWQCSRDALGRAWRSALSVINRVKETLSKCHQIPKVQASHKHTSKNRDDMRSVTTCWKCFFFFRTTGGWKTPCLSVKKTMYVASSLFSNIFSAADDSPSC